MPLIVICGHPCSGKSTVVKQIVAACKAKGCDVVHVEEEALHLTRDASYKNVPSEKNTRGLLRSVVDRTLSRSRIVIFDSLNNIKGYRYELWCLARGAATKYCLVHVATPVETCREWNKERSGDTFCSEIFEDLASRFERPDARNRWDAPLFTVDPTRGPQHVEEQVVAVTAAMTETSQTAAVAAAVTAGAAAVKPIGQDLKPKLATENSSLLAATNLLHEIDRATQAVIDTVSEAQLAAGSGAPGSIQFGEDLPILHLTRQVPLPELRRHKRTFLRLATSNTFNRVRDVAAARRMFIDYLRDNI